MSGDDEVPKNEFTNFLDDIAEEISQKVESLAQPAKALPATHRDTSEERHILDWPSVVDRMIDEMR